MVKRPTNQELCMAFRELLTGKTIDVFNGIAKEDGEFLTPDDLIHRTKPWRNEMWKAFRDIEERMCPTPEIARRYAKEH